MDLYYALFGTNKPVCLIEENQSDGHEVSSRRKSPLTTREGVEEFKTVRNLGKSVHALYVIRRILWVAELWLGLDLVEKC